MTGAAPHQAPALYRRKRVMWVRRHIDLDIIARANLTVSQDHRHDSGFANYVSVGVQIQRRGHQAGHETIELDTGIAKACDLDESRRPKTQASAGGQREKINAARRDVFSEIPRRYRKAPAKQLLKKLGVDEMDLPQVGHCGIPPHTRPVLHRGAQMGISIDPIPATTRMASHGRLLKLWVPLRATATTTPMPFLRCIVPSTESARAALAEPSETQELAGTPRKSRLPSSTPQWRRML